MHRDIVACLRPNQETLQSTLQRAKLSVMMQPSTLPASMTQEQRQKRKQQEQHEDAEAIEKLEFSQATSRTAIRLRVSDCHSQPGEGTTSDPGYIYICI